MINDNDILNLLDFFPPYDYRRGKRGALPAAALRGKLKGTTNSEKLIRIALDKGYIYFHDDYHLTPLGAKFISKEVE